MRSAFRTGSMRGKSREKRELQVECNLCTVCPPETFHNRKPPQDEFLRPIRGRFALGCFAGLAEIGSAGFFPTNQLRDRWMEQISSGDYLPVVRGKYDVARALTGKTREAGI